MSSNTGFAAGKFEPLATVSEKPLTEITAFVGAGAGAAGGAGGAAGAFGALGVPPLDEEDGCFAVVPALGPPASNGSLLSKRENDWSCPVPADCGTAETSCADAVAVVAAGATEPRLGAAGADGVTGAPAGAVEAVTVAVVSAA